MSAKYPTQHTLASTSVSLCILAFVRFSCIFLRSVTAFVLVRSSGAQGAASLAGFGLWVDSCDLPMCVDPEVGVYCPIKSDLPKAGI